MNAVRLLDVVVVSRENRETGTLTSPPLIAIEVRSPSDTQEDLDSRAAALVGMGTRNVWLVDPYAQTGQVWVSRDGLEWMACGWRLSGQGCISILGGFGGVGGLRVLRRVGCKRYYSSDSRAVFSTPL